MKKIERLQNIIYLLSQNRRLSCSHIAKTLEVSPRTIYRDMDALSQMKVPIIAYEGLDGGYELDRSYFFQSVKLTDRELMIMILLLEMGYQLNTTDFDDALITLKHKLLNASGKQPNINNALKHITIEVQHIYPKKIVKGIFNKVIQGLQMERMIIVDYYTPIKNSWLTREISPLHLFYCEGCWYLDAFCNVRKAKRTFRLDRIKSCELLKKDIPEEHMKTYEVNRLSENVPEITLEIDKGLYEQVKDDYIFKEADITKEINSSLTLIVRNKRMEYLAEFAYRNVDMVTVLSPESLIGYIAQKIEKMQKKYL